MALLPARRGDSVAQPGSQAAGWWDPVGEFEDLYQRMGQLMDRAFDGLWHSSGQAWVPAADLTETGDAYVAEVELPGVRKDDIRVELAGRDLRVVGDYSREAADGRGRRRGSGPCEYQVTLPGQADADKITASLADGVLTVTVPKTETEKPRQIQITG